jgi:hypothetical protein
MKRLGLNPELVAKIENVAAVVVVPDKADGLQRKVGSQKGQIHQYVKGGAAGAACLGGDVGEGVLLRPHINHFYRVYNPVTASEKTLS